MVILDDKKITVAYAYGPRNAGDFALNLGSINVLSRLFKKNNITFISRFAEESFYFKETKELLAKYEPKIILYPCFFDVDKYRQDKSERIWKIFLSSTQYSYYHLFPIRGYKKTKLPGIKAISESDIVLCNGGNLFYWNRYRKDIAYLFGILFPFTYAKKIKKPYGFLPQSIGEIDGLGKIILNNIFKEAKFITLRENISKKTLYKTFNLDYPTFLDLAFFIEDNDDINTTSILSSIGLGKKNFIAFNIRSGKLGDTSEFNSLKLKNMLLKLISLIKKLLENFEYDILFVIQNKIDFIFTQQIYNTFKTSRRVHLIEEYDPMILRSIYKQSITSITMRFHAAVFSLSSGTPILGIYDKEWGPKMIGTMNQFNMHHKVFDLSDIDPNKFIDELTDNINNNIFEKEIKHIIEDNKNNLINYMKEKLTQLTFKRI